MRTGTAARCEPRDKPGLESLQGSAGLSNVSSVFSFFSFNAQRVGVNYAFMVTWQLGFLG